MVFALLGSIWLEVLLRTHVLRRWRRLLLAMAPVFVIFIVWDLYAIAQGHWTFDPERTTGVLFPGGLPLDEVIFFLVIPLASVLTLEAVRSVKGWDVGEDAPPSAVQPSDEAPEQEPAS
jgi:lycopene cyclase domain-containing protein